MYLRDLHTKINRWFRYDAYFNIDVLSYFYIFLRYYGFTYDTLSFPRLVQVEIHSGRPHQIRIHLAYIGHPLVGKSIFIIMMGIIVLELLSSRLGGRPQFH